MKKQKRFWEIWGFWQKKFELQFKQNKNAEKRVLREAISFLHFHTEYVTIY